MELVIMFKKNAIRSSNVYHLRSSIWPCLFFKMSRRSRSPTPISKPLEDSPKETSQSECFWKKIKSRQNVLLISVVLFAVLIIFFKSKFWSKILSQPLFVAIKNDKVKLAKLLVSIGADINAKDIIDLYYNTIIFN